MARLSDLPGPTSDAPRRRLWLTGAALASTLVLAVVTAIGTGIGSSALHLFQGDGALISFSETEQTDACGTSLFLRRANAKAAAAQKMPGYSDWQDFRRLNDAIVASPSIVEVSIQGESSRVITLARIDFSVDRMRRPAGAVFSTPCGDATRGRFLEVDLDREPVAVLGSNADPDASRPGRPGGRAVYKPFRVPWTVSLTDPLLLKIIARTSRCYCLWRATITWRSGDQSGVMRVDNHGDGYAVAGPEGVTAFGAGGSARWTRQPRRASQAGR